MGIDKIVGLKKTKKRDKKKKKRDEGIVNAIIEWYSHLLTKKKTSKKRKV